MLVFFLYRDLPFIFISQGFDLCANQIGDDSRVQRIQFPRLIAKAVEIGSETAVGGFGRGSAVAGTDRFAAC